MLCIALCEILMTGCFCLSVANVLNDLGAVARMRQNDAICLFWGIDLKQPAATVTHWALCFIHALH
jgi:hypothetical protein